MQLNYAIVFVSDMAKSVEFYRDVVGIELRFESTHWSEFSTGSATLALHLGEPTDAVDVDPKSPGHCRPGLAVSNLDEFHSRMIAHEVRCVQTPKAVFGARVAQYLDPDGLTISVSEAGNSAS